MLVVKGLPWMKMFFRGIERDEDTERRCWTNAGPKRLGDASNQTSDTGLRSDLRCWQP